jgi:secreted PhoX family phosphatase
MNKSNDHSEGLSRRDLIKGAAAVGAGFATGAVSPMHAAEESPSVARDLIKRENAKPGTRDWILTTTDINATEPVELWRSPRIEGYCSATSVSAGETLPLGKGHEGQSGMGGAWRDQAWIDQRQAGELAGYLSDPRLPDRLRAP